MTDDPCDERADWPELWEKTQMARYDDWVLNTMRVIGIECSSFSIIPKFVLHSPRTHSSHPKRWKPGQ